MSFRRFHDTEEFSGLVSSVLAQNEAENNLIISILDTVITAPGRYANPFLACGTNEKGEVNMVAVMTPPHNIILTREVSSEFIEWIYHKAKEDNVEIPGVLAPDQVGKEACEVIQVHNKKDFYLDSSVRTFNLEKLIPPQQIPEGKFRLAKLEEQEILIDFLQRFIDEANGLVPSSMETFYLDFVEEKRLFVYENSLGEIVSIAGIAQGGTPNGSRIGWVYTPEEERKKGYASAIVSLVSQEIFDRGKKFCFLFTDLENSTTNKIYPLLGYRAICDFNHYNFNL